MIYYIIRCHACQPFFKIFFAEFREFSTFSKKTFLLSTEKRHKHTNTVIISAFFHTSSEKSTFSTFSSSNFTRVYEDIFPLPANVPFLCCSEQSRNPSSFRTVQINTSGITGHMTIHQPLFIRPLKTGILRQVLKALLFRSVVNSPEISVVLVCLIDVVITQEGADECSGRISLCAGKSSQELQTKTSG